MEGAEIEQQNENNKVVERPTTPTKNNNTESQSESHGNQAQKKKKKKRKVTFDLSGNSDFNKFAQPISNPNQISADSILSSSRNVNKSTPLDTLLRDRASNPNDFVSGMGDVDGYQSFSDSESEYNSDLDMDSFEKGLTM